MQISNVEKVISYYSSICEALPIGGYGIKILHDALLEIAVLKTGGVAALQTTNSRYVTALSVYEECVASGEFVIGLSFGDWCKQRLNAEKDPHCT